MIGGNFLVAADRAAQASDATPGLRTHAAAIARNIGRALDSGDDIRATTLARRSLQAFPGTDLFVLSETGEVLLDTPTGLPAPRLKDQESLGDNAFTGWVGEGQYLEIKTPVRGRLLLLGTLHLRQALHVPAWMASIKVFAMWASLASAILTFLYLSCAMRGMVGLHKVLERASYGDFYARAPQVGAFEVRRVIQRTHEAMVSMAAAADEARKVYVETALALSKTIEAKDRYTSGHSQRVAVFAVELAEKIGFDEDRLETLRLGALLHDIGKVAVPDNVLLKPGFLNDEEFAIMKRHPMAGDRILAAIPGLRDMADIARSHHEKWDGSGYPLGVAGDSIPLEGRICSIADAYDALTTKRSYKSAMPLEQALDIIEKDAGTHFDPELAKVFLAMKRNGVGYKALKKPESKEVVAQTTAEEEIQAAKGA
ncbi:MAG: HD-GYP domain-containing protein [Planctomycetes bacterium]|nr:HD-GYP domain-containing protein [Planctomycetota bacterium]MCP4770971.1 HD-GYP domain-containing protein [Planctomycetota bacterium]